jgi:hypothetical protein
MACRLCASHEVGEFCAEVNILLPGLRDLDKPPILVFPKLVVCAHCGFTEFNVPEDALQLLTSGPCPADAGN